jgi:SAM-dependent methyltransferase
MRSSNYNLEPEAAISFSKYRSCATAFARELLLQGHPGEFDDQGLPAYSHPNPLMHWVFWERLRMVNRYLGHVLPHGSRVLDFGCGVGMLIPLLTAHGYRVTGVDLDLRHTLAFLYRFGVIDTTILSADRLLTLQPESFEAITALDVLEHVPDLVATVKQLIRLLRPGGKLVVCGPTENVLYNMGRWLAGFSGDYHVRNIYEIREAIRGQLSITSLGTLYPGMPLFRVFEGTRPSDA